MKQIYKTMIFATALASLGAHAGDREIVTADSPIEFASTPASKLNDQQILESDDFIAFDKWKTMLPAEAAVLGLFHEYKEPTYIDMDSGQPVVKADKLRIWVSELKTVVNASAADVQKKLPLFTNIDRLRDLDRNVQLTPISDKETLPYLVSHQLPVHSFENCLDSWKRNWAIQPTLENDVNSAGTQPWCQPSSNRTCFNTCVGIGKYQTEFEIASKAFSHPEDAGLAFQSEITTYGSEAEYAPTIPLAKLTGITTPVVAVVEQNIFYMDHFTKFGKVVFFLNQHPTDASKTILTAYIVLGVKERSLKRMNGKSFKTAYKSLADVLANGLAGSTPGTMLAGIPSYASAFVPAVINMLENKELASK